MSIAKKIFYALRRIRREIFLFVKLFWCNINPDVAKRYFGNELMLTVDAKDLQRSVKIYVFIDGKRIKPKHHFVLDGPWDIEAGLFSEDQTCIDAIGMLVDKRDYKNTVLYKKYLSRMKCNNPEIHHNEFLDTEEKLEKYFRSIYSVFENIKVNGYKSQEELGGQNSEIGVAIGRSGELLHFRTGHHRLAIAKLLNTERIPVEVHFVHYRWLRKCMRKYKTIPTTAIRKGLEERKKKTSS